MILKVKGCADSTKELITHYPKYKKTKRILFDAIKVENDAILLRVTNLSKTKYWWSRDWFVRIRATK
jgi:hypothetical protein